MLRLENILIRSGGFEVRADAELPDGGVTAIVGPSGAGKSTLLAGIAGFLPLASGRILWGGRDIGGLSPGERPLAILFQDNNLFPHLTLAQNVGLGLSPSLKLDAAQKAEVDQALSRVGLGGLGGRRPAETSGGQQSRAALARVLVMKRPLLLLDEPFGALGPGLKTEMLELVRATLAERGASALMVSHDPEDARAFAEHTVFIAEGVARPPVPTAELFADPPPELRAYLGK